MAQKGTITMWETIKNLILRLFGVKPTQSASEANRSNGYAAAYEEARSINFTAIFASRLSVLAVTDGTVTVTGENVRSAYLDGIVQARIMARAQKIVSGALGCGGIVLVPYIADSKIYVGCVPQHRFYILRQNGDDITRAVILADYITRSSKKYARYTEYELLDGACYIRNRATVNDTPCALDTLPEWAGMPEEVGISGCDRLLFGYLKCPQDNRRADSFAGVPITYGCDDIIEQIRETMTDEAVEYRNKKGFIGVDATMFDENNKLPQNGIFKTFIGQGGEDLWKEYSPEIRYAAYSARVQFLFELLEKAVGTSKGILTTPDPQATATATRHAQHDTWALVGNIRKAAERAITDAVYAINVLCNYYSLTAQGDYAISFDWDMSMLEDTAETWQQLRDGYSMRIRSKAELRSWQTGETIEEAQAAVDEIEANDPGISDLIGNA